MAVIPKKFGVSIDLDSNEILNASFEKLAAPPAVTYPGRFYFDTTLDSLRVRNFADTAWIDIGSVPPGLFKIKGLIDASTNPAFPASPSDGDVHLITVAGTVGGIALDQGDMLVYFSGTWAPIEKNTIRATELLEGYTRLATQAETNAGTDDTTSVTPLKLKVWASFLGLVKQYEATIVGDGVATQFVVPHGFNSKNIEVQVFEVATDAEVITDVQRSSVNDVTIGILPARAVGVSFDVIVQSKGA